MLPSLANDISPNTLGMSPSTPPPRAINMPLEEGSSIRPQAEAAAPPRPGTPMPISSPDVLKYNPYEDWQQRLNINQMRQQSRTAKVAAAAGAAAAAAHVRRGALDVIIDRKQQQTPRSQAAVNSDRHLDEQRGIRNINLLSSALHIIREMDPDYVEKLCYAIHDHMSREKPLD
ncbi:uncharacterized protein LOC132796621 [Drosophila nasuta]|uniref:uncharacterized protein LOC132796621 n=1 Tax=Drosophila nasuta TaxID=42062 RepID=UPI00295F427E|nr:uncharacterized protein LOC132796621 [Drosophila nasuta]